MKVNFWGSNSSGWIILSLNGYDYGGVEGVSCGFYDGDDNHDDDDVGDDDDPDHDYHDDAGAHNFLVNQSFWYAMFWQLNYLFLLFIFD